MQQRSRKKTVILPKLKPDRQLGGLLVVTACFGEIFFHGKPVLVGVEPHSTAWVLGEHAADRSASTWRAAMKDFNVLGQAWLTVGAA